MFYAALELRCAVEARLQEYLQSQVKIAEKKKMGWEIPKLAKDLESVFNIGEQVVQLIFTDKASGEQMPTYYTPVNKSLRAKAGQLGNYLHAMQISHTDNDPWWLDMQKILEGVLKDARQTTIGTLLGPPLVSKDGSSFTSNHELEVISEQDQFFDGCAKAGTIFQVAVAYLTELPEDYVAAIENAQKVDAKLVG